MGGAMVGAANDRGDPVTPAAEIEGRLDAVAAGRAYGWARDRTRPDDTLDVEIRLGRQVLATVRADRPRPDLESGGIGRHAFEIDLPDAVGDVEGGTLTAFVVTAGGGEVPLADAAAEPGGAETDAVLALSLHLFRLAERVELLRQDQRMLGRTQATLARSVADIAARMPAADQAGTPQDLADRLAEIAAAQAQLADRVSGLEVFLVRMDGAMAGIDGHIAAGAGTGRRGMIDLRLALAALAGLGVIGLLGLLLALA